MIRFHIHITHNYAHSRYLAKNCVSRMGNPYAMSSGYLIATGEPCAPKNIAISGPEMANSTGRNRRLVDS
jgi:hypothetical protein